MKIYVQASQHEEIPYKDYYISYNTYGSGEYSVEYCGDDVIFDSEDEAKQFIDEISEDNVESCSVIASSEWALDWSARRNLSTGADYYVLSLPTGTARVFHDLYKDLYYAKVKLAKGGDKSSSEMRGLIPCMNWAENVLVTYV